MDAAIKGNVLIAGAGPVGLATALHCAAKGYKVANFPADPCTVLGTASRAGAVQVTCYEKRADDSAQWKQSPPRSVFCTLGARGLEALKSAGVHVSGSPGSYTADTVTSLRPDTGRAADPHQARRAPGR